MPFRNRSTLSVVACLPIAVLLAAIAVPPPSSAQIQSDTTLPNNSVVTPIGVNVFAITGGTTGGTAAEMPNSPNLFHSFREFSVPTNGAAVFDQAPSIRNIFTRVTGGSISNIDGLIRSNTPVNFFLLNPNGIIFGPNAQLSVGGSFLGSTGDRIRFSDGSEFSASNPTTPAVLTITAPIGIQFGSNPGAIQVNGRGHQSELPTDNPGIALVGQTLGLLGGDVSFEGGVVTALSGRIEVGSVQDGFVSLAPHPFGLQLGYDQVQRFGTIQLANRSSLFNPAQDANPYGGIQVQGGDISLNNAQIAGLNAGSSPLVADVTVTASESLTLGGVNAIAYPFSSWIVNQVAPNATGTSGNVLINVPQLTLRDGALISTINSGSNQIGNVVINADNIVVDGFSPILTSSPSAIASFNRANGRGGDVSITARQVTLQNGGVLGVITLPGVTGSAGNISINASEAIALIGANSSTQSPSSVGSYSDGLGDSGGITITTRQLNFQDGGVIISEAKNNAQSGDIVVTADTVFGRGVNPFGQSSRLPSGIFSTNYGSEPGANITLTTRKLDFADGVSINSLAIRSPQSNDPRYPGSGTGDAGNIVVNASELIELSGFSPNAPEVITGIISNTLTAGRSGAVTVSTPNLILREGASISSLVVPFLLSRGGEPLPDGVLGDGGNIVVNVSNTATINGFNPVTRLATSIGTFTFGSGNAGRTEVNATRLQLQAGGMITSSTSASGNAGQLLVRANDISIDGSEAFPSAISASAELQDEATRRAYLLPLVPTGNTGEVQIISDRLSLTNGGQVTVQHDGPGNVGRLQIDADRVQLDNRSRISATTVDGQGGSIAVNGRSLSINNGSTITGTTDGIGNGSSITVNADQVDLINGGQISTSTMAQGRAGNISIDAKNTVAIAGTDSPSGTASGLFANATNAATGAGGNLQVTTGRLSLQDGGQMNVTTAGQGNAGTIVIQAREAVEVTGESANRQASSILTRVETGASGAGGNLAIATNQLSIQSGGSIAAGSRGSGNSGDLTVTANRIELTGTSRSGVNRTELSTNTTASGQGGDLTLTGDRLVVKDGAAVQTGTEGSGNAGDLSVTVRQVELNGRNRQQQSGLLTTAGRSASGEGGDINLSVDTLRLIDGGQVRAGTSGAGRSGDLTVRSRQLIEVVGSSGSFASGLSTEADAGSTGASGDVQVSSDRLLVSRGGQINTATSGSGLSGDLTIRANQVSIQGGANRRETGLFTTTNSTNQQAIGGDVRLTANQLEITEGGQISASTLGTAIAGDVLIRANQVEVSGSSRDGVSSAIAAAAIPSRAGQAGGAGSVQIRADQVTVRDGGLITVSSLGSGDAGNLQIWADGIQLSNQGRLLATLREGDRGNISLTADQIVLNNQSLISTDAQGNATGGNINLRTRYLFAFNNSDITANAINSFGGNVTVSAQGIFGTTFRDQLTPQSDITASSARGAAFGGSVNLEVPNVDPSQGVAELPETVVDPNTQVATACSASDNNTFTASGRGGIPESPDQLIHNHTPWQDLRLPEDADREMGESDRQVIRQPNNTAPDRKPLVEAQAWMVDAQGKVRLVAVAAHQSEQVSFCRQ
jgi:filamentous hemagglutinin family protein